MIKNAKEILKKARTAEIALMPTTYGNGFKVISGASGRTYYVHVRRDDQGDILGGTCSCPWGFHRGDMDRRSACNHVMGVIEFDAKQKGKTIMVHVTEESAKKARRPKTDIGDGVIVTLRRKTLKEA